MTQYSAPYLAYAKAHNKAPDEMLVHDKAAWPGGCMAGFILWVRQKKKEFFVAHPEAFMDRDAIRDFAAWNQFLKDVA